MVAADGLSGKVRRGRSVRFVRKGVENRCEDQPTVFCFSFFCSASHAALPLWGTSGGDGLPGPSLGHLVELLADGIAFGEHLAQIAFFDFALGEGAVVGLPA